MSRESNITVPGVVTKQLKGTNFIVTLENKAEVICTISGKLRMNKIRIIVGDEVEVQISPYDLTKGIIIWRTVK